MTIQKHSAQVLIEKIQSLPDERIAEVEDFMNFLKAQTELKECTVIDKQVLDFPVISVGVWPDHLSLRREDMYGDEGR